MQSVPIFLVGISIFLLGVGLSRKVPVGPCVLVVEEPGDCPDPDYVKVYLFTRENKDYGQYVAVSETSDNLTSSHFRTGQPNKLVIHGYNSDMYLGALQDIKAEYLRQGDVNVWMVNYPLLATGSALCYPFAVHNIHHVGHCLYQLVVALRRHQAAPLHVIAFSLGAHIPNYIAQKLGSPKLARITGLDPAGPLFTGRNKDHRLDPSDADFVDVVHTNSLVQGTIERCGHIDFYMNGGVSQPGCLNTSHPFTCDHHRAPQYFAESIRTTVGFLGWPCEDYVHYLSGECIPTMSLLPMGDPCTYRNSTGFFIAYTASEEPFALGNWTDQSYQQRAPKTSFTDTKQLNTRRLALTNSRVKPKARMRVILQV